MSKLRVTNNGDGSFTIKPSKYGEEVSYAPGGDWKANKEFLGELKRQGLEVPEDKRGREAYLKELDENLRRADRYGRDRIDGLPDVGSKDEEAPRKSRWF